MDDPPLTKLELAELKRIRIGKPPSYAAPANSYQSAERFAKLRGDRELAERKREAQRRKRERDDR